MRQHRNVGPGIENTGQPGSQVKTTWSERVPDRLTSRMSPPRHSLLKKAKGADASLLTASVEATDLHTQLTAI